MDALEEVVPVLPELSRENALAGPSNSRVKTVDAKVAKGGKKRRNVLPKGAKEGEPFTEDVSSSHLPSHSFSCTDETLAKLTPPPPSLSLASQARSVDAPLNPNLKPQIGKLQSKLHVRHVHVQHCLYRRRATSCCEEEGRGGQEEGQEVSGEGVSPYRRMPIQRDGGRSGLVRFVVTRWQEPLSHLLSAYGKATARKTAMIIREL